MTYYPAWFDYAKWMLAVSGGLCIFAIKSQAAGQLRGRLKLFGLLLVALGMIFGATAGVLFNSRASESDAAGIIARVHRTSGRGASTHFDVTQPDGTVLTFRIPSELREIADGEEAKIHYQDGSNKVLYLSIIAGQYAGFIHSDSNGLFGSYVLFVGAFVLFAYALWDFFSDGLGTTLDSEKNLRPGPGGDVDEQSLFKL